jgi:hypothetical protein
VAFKVENHLAVIFRRSHTGGENDCGCDEKKEKFHFSKSVDPGKKQVTTKDKVYF